MTMTTVPLYTPVPGTQVMYFELLDGIYLNLFFPCRSNNEWVPPYVPGTLILKTYLYKYKYTGK